MTEDTPSRFQARYKLDIPRIAAIEVPFGEKTCRITDWDDDHETPMALLDSLELKYTIDTSKWDGKRHPRLKKAVLDWIDDHDMDGLTYAGYGELKVTTPVEETVEHHKAKRWDVEQALRNLGIPFTVECLKLYGSDQCHILVGEA